MTEHPSDENPYEPPHQHDDFVVAGRRPLMLDRSFWGMTATQFLGAFNDNVFKQLMLLLAITAVSTAGNPDDEQGLATQVFSLPFILFSGFAGYLSDRYSKRRIIVLAKLAEILIMLLGLAAFFSYDQTGYRALLVVLFLMGTHSAFFGPGKYGILPEMLREEDLPRANGIILMTTFLAIIFGTASAGMLGDLPVHRLWVGSAICVGIAAVGTCTSLLIRPLPAAQPGLKFSWDTVFIPREILRLLRRDWPLLLALLASCLFWLVSGIAIQAVNSLGLVQLGLNKTQTSLMTAIIGLGIAVGAVVAGKLCQGRADFRVVRGGAWGLVATLLLLSISLPGGRHLLGFKGSLPALALLGVSAGFFAIPVQVFLQTRAPAGLKGRMIATMNIANFIAIWFAGVLYERFDTLLNARQWPRSYTFAFMAALTLPVALFYRPKVDSVPVTQA
jgi:MFS family permease